MEYRTWSTKLSAIWSGPAKPQPTTRAANASSYFPSSCALGGSTRTAVIGHWRRRWLARQSFEHTAQQIVFQEKIDAIEDASQRLHRLDEQLRAVVPTWSMGQVVEAYQVMRGARGTSLLDRAASSRELRARSAGRERQRCVLFANAENSLGSERTCARRR